MRNECRAAADTVTSRLTRDALAADVYSLAPAVIDKAKTCLLDFISCAFEARDLPWSRQALDVATRVTRGANVIATDAVCAPADAAFANAVLGHGLVREDMHVASIVHLGVVVWPTLLALAQRTPVSGKALLAAAVIGYEVGGRIGRKLMTSDLARLFRPTGLIGPLAAALAGGRLVGLSWDRAVDALALAANTCSGLNQWPYTGGSEMYFHPGFVCRNALTCVELAESGAESSDNILEGEAGLFAAYARRGLTTDIDIFPNDEAEILAVFNKPVPACNFAQTPCLAALHAIRELGGSSARVVAVDVAVSEAAHLYPGCNVSGPFARPLQAKMSIPFGVAATIARGAIEEDNYRRLDDAEIGRLLSVTRLRSEPKFTAAYPGAQGTRVVLTLDDGSMISRELADVVAASPQFVRQRFRHACGAALGDHRTSRIESFVDELERQSDAGQLAALCALPRQEDAGFGTRSHA